MKLWKRSWMVPLTLALIAIATLGEDVKPLMTFSEYTGWIKSVAFSPDGKVLATASGDHMIRLWEVATGREVNAFQDGWDPPFVVFSPDGRLIAYPDGSSVVLREVATDHVVRVLNGHSDLVFSAAFSPNGRLLASASQDGTIKLWDVTTGREIRTLRGHTKWPNSVTFSPDGTLIASVGCREWVPYEGCSQGEIKLWEVSTGREVRTLTGHICTSDLAFSPEGVFLAASCCRDWRNCRQAEVKLWEMPMGREVRTLTCHTSRVWVVAFSPDGKLLASGSYKEIKFWDVETGRELRAFTAHEGTVLSLAFSPDGSLLASGSDDNTVKLWDVQDILCPNESPMADFAWEVLTPEGVRPIVRPFTGDRIRFDASDSNDPDGKIEKYEWDWDSDGRFDLTTTEPMVEHVFDKPGTYRVTLRVTDDKGATATVIKTITVVERKPPIADFTFAPASPTVLDTIRFIDRSHDPDGEVVSWHWEFGDGTTSSERNPTHHYQEKGKFAVRLTVTDDDGLTATVEKEITVVNTPPVAEFTVPDGIYTNFAALFDASASHDPDGEIVKYEWDFDGDGVMDAEGQKVEWTFTEEGTYIVVLIVTDDDGATAKAEVEVEVKVGGGGGPA